MLTESHPLETTENVFVYGTLQRDFNNHSVMKSANGHFLGRGRTIDHYPLLVEGLPYLHKHKGIGHHVFGEVYKVDSIWPLDLLESHPIFYKREVIDISTTGKGILPCWTYFVNNSSREVSDFKDNEMFYSFKQAIQLQSSWS